MKNICILRNNQIKPDSRVEKEAACLIEAGYNVKVLAWDRESDHAPEEGIVHSMGVDIPVVWFGCKASFGGGMSSLYAFLKFQKSIFTWLRHNKNNVDIIHACDFDTAFIASFIKRFYGKTLVFDVFDFWFGNPENLFQRIVRGLQNKTINFSDATIICTEERRHQIRDSKPKNLTIIHNTPPKVNIEKFYNLSSEKTKVCYVGIFQEGRLLEEMSQFFVNHPEIELHIGGFGKYESLYENLACQYPNIFYYGRLLYEQTLALENSCDIMLAIYDPKEENHVFAAPNKFYESLMLGKPVVMAKGTGLSSIVDNEKIGVTIDYSLNGLEQGILALDSIKDVWPDMSKRMKSLYREKYGWDEMKVRLLNLYSHLTHS